MKTNALIVLSVLALLSMSVLIYSAEPFQAAIAVPRDAPKIPMTFAHRDHAKEACASCHHNYVDDTGHDLCLSCHLNRVELTFKVRQQFHDLCEGCHLEKQLEGEEHHGPVRSCTACHIADEQP